jgi:hypothetical protein
VGVGVIEVGLQAARSLAVFLRTDDVGRAGQRDAGAGGAGMSHDSKCRELARYVLRDHRLTPNERIEETERLAETIQRVIEAELESLAHRLHA